MNIETILAKLSSLRLKKKGLDHAIELETLKIKEKRAPEIAKLDKEISDLEAEALKYAEKNQAALLAAPLKIGSAEIGYSLCPPSVSFLEGVNEKIVLARLEAAKLKQYIRTKTELAKSELLRNPPGEKILAKLGISIGRQAKYYLDFAAS